MTWFLQSIDLDVWDVIEDDPTFPSKLVDEVMPKQEWDEHDRRIFQLNAKVVYTMLASSSSYILRTHSPFVSFCGQSLN